MRSTETSHPPQSRILPFLLLLGLIAIALVLVVLVPNQRGALEQDYRVYEALFQLMTRLPKEDPQVAIYSRTLNANCGLERENLLPTMNNCGWFWIEPDTVKEIERLLAESWPTMRAATWLDFRAKTGASVGLVDRISTPWRHTVIGPADAKWQSKSHAQDEHWDLILFVSRVGFNPGRTEAMVYVLMFSYIDEIRSGGDYFLFRRSVSGRWEPAGRIVYMRQGERHKDE